MSTKKEYKNTRDSHTFLTKFEAKLFANAMYTKSYEWRASSFWQIPLQRLYSLSDDFGVVWEQPASDDTRTRVDITVLRFDPDEGDILSTLHVEAKKKDGDRKAALTQGRTAARLAIRERSLGHIYVMATEGVRFMFFKMTMSMTSSDDEPVEINLGRKYGGGSGFIDLDTNGYDILVRCIDASKGDKTSKQPPMLPSQQYLLPQTELPIRSGTYGSGSDTYGSGSGAYGSGSGAYSSGSGAYGSGSGAYGSGSGAYSSGSATYGSGSGSGSGATYQGYTVASLEDDIYVDDSISDSRMGGSSGSEQGSSGQFRTVEVVVKKISHSMRPNEIHFRDEKGKNCPTKETDWKRGRQGSHSCYYYNYKGVKYWCWKLK